MCDLRIVQEPDKPDKLTLSFFPPFIADLRSIVRAITGTDHSSSPENVNRTLSEICARAASRGVVIEQKAVKSKNRYVLILEKPVTEIHTLSYCQDPSAKTYNRPTRILFTHMPTHGTDLVNDVSTWLKLSLIHI